MDSVTSFIAKIVFIIRNVPISKSDPEFIDFHNTSNQPRAQLLLFDNFLKMFINNQLFCFC